jgi:hypothetical protein
MLAGVGYIMFLPADHRNLRTCTVMSMTRHAWWLAACILVGKPSICIIGVPHLHCFKLRCHRIFLVGWALMGSIACVAVVNASMQVAALQQCCGCVLYQLWQLISRAGLACLRTSCRQHMCLLQRDVTRRAQRVCSHQQPAVHVQHCCVTGFWLRCAMHVCGVFSRNQPVSWS